MFAHSDRGWVVKVAHEDMFRSHHATREAAVGAGRELARLMRTELRVYDIDGSLCSRDLYGNSF